MGIFPFAKVVEVAIGALEVVELGLLASPENAESEEAHEVGNELGSEGQQGAVKLVFAVHCVAERDVQVENQQGHSDREDAVA
jgi:hypothetical protein